MDAEDRYFNAEGQRVRMSIGGPAHPDMDPVPGPDDIIAALRDAEEALRGLARVSGGLGGVIQAATAAVHRLLEVAADLERQAHSVRYPPEGGGQ
jgi:hypothetical protein